MVGIVSDKHRAFAVETDAVSDAAVGQLDKYATFSFGGVTFPIVC